MLTVLTTIHNAPCMLCYIYSLIFVSPSYVGISLVWVAILFVVMLYIYSVVSFAFLHESFLMPNDHDSLFCNTLFECFITMIRYGLMDNPGLVC